MPDGSEGVNHVRLESVGGTTRVALGEDAKRNRQIEFQCSSGERFGATWCGVPMDHILSHVELPPEMTHLVLTSVDGFRVCVSIAGALDGLLATAADGESISGSPRFVSPAIDGPRTIKRVDRLKPMRLCPNDSPEEFENIVDRKDS